MKQPRRLPYLERVNANLVLPRGYDGMWRVMLDLDEAGPWTVRDVWGRMNENIGSVHQYLRRLKLAGIARQVGERLTGGKNPQAAPLYRLTQRPLETPRLREDGTAQPEPLIETLWRTIKMAKAFTAAELAALAGRDGRIVNVASARSYCDNLTRAGLLGRTIGNDRQSRYQLLVNAGAKAPKILAGHIVYDPNAGQVLGDMPVREVQP